MGFSAFNEVKDIDYVIKDEKQVTTFFRERISDEVNLTFNYIEEIPKTKAGKFKMFVSDLPR